MAETLSSDTIIATGNPSLSAIVVTYNSADVLPGLLDSFLVGLSGVDRCEVIIVDNASSDESVALARQHPCGARIIEMGCNVGYAAAINAAMATVDRRADVLVLNPDIRLLPGAAALLRRRLDDPQVGIAVPRILTEEGTVASSLRREPSLTGAWVTSLLGGKRASAIGVGDIVTDPQIYSRDQDVDWATGCILMIGARTRRLVGEWDESFFLYCEEVDFMRRTRQAGLKIAYVPEATATHFGGPYHENPLLLSLMAVNQLRDFSRHNGRIRTTLYRWALVIGEIVPSTNKPCASRGCPFTSDVTRPTPIARAAAALSHATLSGAYAAWSARPSGDIAHAQGLTKSNLAQRRAHCSASSRSL